MRLAFARGSWIFRDHVFVVGYFLSPERTSEVWALETSTVPSTLIHLGRVFICLEMT